MNKFTLSLLSATLAFGASGVYATDITDLNPGELATVIGDDTSEITTLKLTGNIDVRDLLVVAELPSLVSLDLSDARIQSYIPLKPLSLPDGEFPENYLPASIFFGKKLESLNLPTSLTAIGGNALAGNNFVAIVLPEGLQTIGDYAFYDCDNLTDISIPASLKALGNYSFASCDELKTVNLAASTLATIPDYAFRNDKKLAEIVLPGTLASIGHGAFAGCESLKGLELPSSLASIGAQAFTLSGLEEVAVPSSVDEIGDFAYANVNNMTEATFPSGALLGDGVFYYSTALETVNADGLTSIPDYAFTGNERLPFVSSNAFADVSEIGAYALLDTKADYVVLSPTLTFIGDGAFEGMKGLVEIDATGLGDNVPELGMDVFAGLDQPDITLKVAEFTGEAWRNAPQWKEFKIDEVSGIDGTVADTASSVRAWFEGTELQISAPEEIESVTVYLTGGAKVFHVEPYTTRVSVDTSDFTDRMYIVEVISPLGRKVIKLMR